MTKINVICGGSSAEREVSLRSGAAVAQALQAAGYEVAVLDLAVASHTQLMDCDVVFPVLHGAGGEDGTFQAQLEAARMPYVGSDSKASSLCFDKWQYRQVVEAYGLPMAHGVLVQGENYAELPLAHSPYVLKPVNGGSSIDTYIVRDPAHTPHSEISDTFHRYPTMLLEQLIEGIELTVGILDRKPLPVIEIIPPKSGEFDYENKYNGATQELCPPLHVNPALQSAAQDLARRAHELTGCRDFSRTDMMCDTSGRLFLLETNTIPGMTDQSLFPKMAATAGITMPELCSQLVMMALAR